MVFFSRHATKAAVAAWVLCFSTSAAFADPILYVHDSSNRLGTVNVGVTSGGVNVIGTMGSDTMTDIAFNASGDLYGVSFSNLYKINKNTAAITLVGSLGSGINGSNALVFGTDGSLYMASNNSTQLYKVNTGSGAATAIGDIGFMAAGDLAFYQGQLYLSATNNDLIRITLSGGSATGGTDLGSLDHTSVFGLATGDDGVLYGVAGTTVFSIDPNVSGVGTADVRDYSGNGLDTANGSAFFAEAGAAVPAPSGLVIAAIGVGLMGLSRTRRRRPALV